MASSKSVDSELNMGGCSVRMKLRGLEGPGSGPTVKDKANVEGYRDGTDFQYSADTGP